MLGPASEVFLSYLTGLAPVGEPIEPRLEWLLADLGYRQKVSIYRCLGELMRAGCVKKLAAGANGTVGVLVVARRLEDMAESAPVSERNDHGEVGGPQPFRAWQPTGVPAVDWAERLAEIPDDTRDLTARFFGDPLPGDTRRQRRTGEGKRGISLARTAATCSPGDEDRQMQGKAAA